MPTVHVGIPTGTRFSVSSNLSRRLFVIFAFSFRVTFYFRVTGSATFRECHSTPLTLPVALAQLLDSTHSHSYHFSSTMSIVTPAGETVIIPRNFKLLEELEKSEKGQTEMSISFGLTDPSDVFLSDWNGGILGPGGVRFVLLKIFLHDYVRLARGIALSCNHGWDNPLTHDISLNVLFLIIIISLFQSLIQTQFDQRWYELRIHCPESYPAAPPEVKFLTKINLSCVDSKTGRVISKKLPAMKAWNRNMGIEQVLVALRQEMCTSENRKLKQTSEGAMF